MREKGECVCSGGGAGGRKAPLPFASPGGLPVTRLAELVPVTSRSDRKSVV